MKKKKKCGFLAFLLKEKLIGLLAARLQPNNKHVNFLPLIVFHVEDQHQVLGLR